MSSLTLNLHETMVEDWAGSIHLVVIVLCIEMRNDLGSTIVLHSMLLPFPFGGVEWGLIGLSSRCG